MLPAATARIARVAPPIPLPSHLAVTVRVRWQWDTTDSPAGLPASPARSTLAGEAGISGELLTGRVALDAGLRSLAPPIAP